MSDSAPVSRENVSTVSAAALVAAILALALSFFLLRQHNLLRDMVVALEVRDSQADQRTDKQIGDMSTVPEKVTELEAQLAALQARMDADDAEDAAEEAEE